MTQHEPSGAPAPGATEPSVDRPEPEPALDFEPARSPEPAPDPEAALGPEPAPDPTTDRPIEPSDPHDAPGPAAEPVDGVEAPAPDGPGSVEASTEPSVEPTDRPDTNPADARPDALAAGPVAASAIPSSAGAGSAAGPAIDPADVVISMRGVSRAFDKRVVVRDIDLTVPRGTILGVIGPSGSGKTTTIRMLTGALAPTGGEISVLGEVPTRFHRSTRERIGYMPQLFTLYKDLTTGENVDFVASLFGMLWRRRRRRVKEVLQVVDLWDARKRQAGNLSGGMQRRLELACALVNEPALLILDEPTAGIDPLLRTSIWEELHRVRDAGRTLLVTTQHVSEAEECDAVALIVRGQIIALAPPDELRRSATRGDVVDVETAALFDGTTLDGLPGVVTVRQDGPRTLRVTVEDAGVAIPTIVDAIRAGGVEVVSARETRPTFDEVFSTLVEAWQQEHPDDATTDEEAAA